MDWRVWRGLYVKVIRVDYPKNIALVETLSDSRFFARFTKLESVSFWRPGK